MGRGILQNYENKLFSLSNLDIKVNNCQGEECAQR